MLDYGMFLQNIMIAAAARELDTCPQAAWNRFSKIVLQHIGASFDEMLVCGMAMGYADSQAIENMFSTSKIDPDLFTTWLD